jgi:hypothetical protein
MPRYFFNVYHENAEPDEIGEQLTDLDAAWKEAIVTAGQILQDLDGKFQPGVDWRLEVTDEFANLLFVINVNAKLAHPIHLSR